MAEEKPVAVSESTSIAMPIRNLISIVAAVALGVWAYFGVQERLNKLEVFEQLVKADVDALEKELKTDIEKNNEFRINGQGEQWEVYQLTVNSLCYSSIWQLN